jgi:hypothetical protein
VSDPIARNIVSQLGDLYMDFTHPATTDRTEFVKYRQATNDQADAFVEALLRQVREQAWDAGASLAARTAVILGAPKDLPERVPGHNPHRTAPAEDPPRPSTYHEALAASGGLLNAPDGDGCTHHWRTFADAQGRYGCCVRCAQRCLACVRGLDSHGPGRVMVCTVCGAGHGVVKVPSA